jgi:predicted small secreted protein
MKKLFVIILALIFAASLMAACGGGGRDQAEGTNDVTPGEVTEPSDNEDVTETTDVDDAEIVDDYNDLSAAIADIPAKAALDEIYIYLEGYWTTIVSEFTGFFNEDGEHWIEYGLIETEYWNRGYIADGEATDVYEAAFLAIFPEIPASELNDGYPAHTETISIDFSYLSVNNSIRVKIESLGDGEWLTYTYGGDTLEAALNNRDV